MTAALSRLNKVVPNAPSVRLPLQFMLVGILSLFAVVGFFVARPDLLSTYHYNQYIIAVTHLLALGWISSVIMGAMYQLVPVALETKLHSEKVAHRQFWFHIIGFVGMVWMFWGWNVKEAGYFGLAVAVGVGMFVYNISRTLMRVPRWTVIATAISASLFWLTFGILAGLYVALAKCWNFSPFAPLAQMHGHAHLPVIGFFIQMLVGVSYKLVPMFALSDIQSTRRAGWSIALVNAGLLGSFICILLQSPAKPLFAAVIVSGLSVYGIEMFAILKARKRKVLDWGLKYLMTALVMLIPASLLGLILSWPTLPMNAFTGQLENAYALIAFLGVLTLAIVGMLYKVIPFLVWYGTYSHEIGKSKVPSLADLYSPLLQAVGYWTYLAGLTIATVATVLAHEKCVRVGCVFLGLSLAVFAINVGRMLLHLFSPKIEPLTIPTIVRGAA